MFQYIHFVYFAKYTIISFFTLHPTFVHLHLYINSIHVHHMDQQYDNSISTHGFVKSANPINPVHYRNK